MDVVILGMLKKYIQETLVGMGALKGAPCTVQGVVDNGDGTQTLTLKWEDTEGGTHTSDIVLPSAIFDITSPTNGQTIRYNAVSGMWENSNVSFSANLDDLDDVVITSVQNGQVLTYDAANNRWVNSNGSTVATLSDLTDVTVTTVQNGQLLSYNSTTNKWINVTLNIDDLGNVSITSAADGQILTYNGTSGKWENKTLELDAADIDYDNTISGLAATTAQGAIDEIVLDVSQLSASKIGYDGTTSGLSANKVQGAIDELADEKVDKETGKGLSANDFTTALKDKLDGIEAGAEVNDIDTIKVNGTALTPDANKAVNVELAMDKLSDVDLTDVADGMILIYDAANDKWYAGANTGASYTAGEGIEIDQNNVISSKMVLFTGTEAQWAALSLADKIKFTHYATNDDQTGQIDPVPTQNSNNLMTSGGIYNALQDKANVSDLGTAAAKDSTNAVTQSSTDLVESGAVYTAIDNAVKALDVTDAAVAGSYVTAVSETDGSISVTREAADAAPTEDSNKLLKSGGAFTSEQDIYKVIGRNGAKNLIPFDLDAIKAANTDGTWSGNVYTRRNVTYTVNSDYSVDVVADGITNTQASGFFYYIADGSESFVGKEVIITGCPSGGGANTYNVQGYRASTVDGSGGTEKDTGDGVTFNWLNNGTGTAAMITISVNAEVAIDAKFRPMLRYSEDTDNTYQPYAMTNQQITPYVQAISNPNLLDNPWFTVNQRGITTLSEGGDVYTVDRWMKSASTIIFALSNDGTVSLTNTGTATPEWRQRIEPDFAERYLNGRKFTLSVLKDGVVYSATDTYDYSANEILARIDIGDAYVELRNLPTLTYRCFVRVIFKANTQNKTVSGILAIKLEIGSVSTLAMDTAPNYQQELAKCQRYFERIGGSANEMFGSGLYESTTQFTAAIKIQPKRIDPSVSLNGTAYCWDGGHIGSSGDDGCIDSQNRHKHAAIRG